MIPDFETNRPYIENEFENARYDPASGMDIDTLRDGLVQLYRENADLPSPILRAKGIVPCVEGGWIHFDYTPGEAEVRMGAADYTGRLCVIGAQLNEAAVAALFKL